VVALAVIFTLMNNSNLSKNQDMPQYNVTPDNYKTVSAMSLMSFFLILMRLVPLDLIINTEVGKIVVSKFIEKDSEMIKIDSNNGDLINCRVQSM
jgi:hypothetical protein